MADVTRQIYEFGSFRLIPEEKQLLRDGAPVALTPKSFDLLAVLVKNSGRLLEKSVLLDQVWPDSFVEEANLSVKMTELRRALGETPNAPQYIETVPRRGYRFVAEVKELVETTAPGLKRSSEDAPSRLSEDNYQTDSGDSRSRLSRRNRTLLIIAASFVVLGVLLFWGTGWWQAVVLHEADPPHIRSIAVLPLENLSQNDLEEYFADGMTDALITNLSMIGALQVRSRPSVMQYKGMRLSLAEIARELQVDAVLTGSIMRSDGRIRISVQLAQTGSDRNLWANTYERDLSDVLDLQKEVTQDIVREVRVKLSPDEQNIFDKRGPVSAEAMEEYLRGEFFLHSQDKENNEAAIRSLEQAVAIDNNFAPAWAALSQAYVWKLFLFRPDDSKLSEKAFIAAEKALRLDPDLAVAYLARGRLLWTPANHFPHDKAIHEFRRALNLNPNLDEARNQLALVYCHVGRFDDAIAESQKAIEINPTNTLAQFRIGQTFNFQGKYADALSILQAIPAEVNPALVGHQIAWSLFNLGKREEAAALIQKLLKDNPEDEGGLFTSIRAVLEASAGEVDLARRDIKAAIEKGRGFGHFHHTAYHIACAYALLKMPAEAVKWLEEASDDGFPCYPLFADDRNLDDLRGHDEFTVFMNRLKERWSQYQAAQ